MDEIHFQTLFQSGAPPKWRRRPRDPVDLGKLTVLLRASALDRNRKRTGHKALFKRVSWQSTNRTLNVNLSINTVRQV
jgi:hypothetical protein